MPESILEKIDGWCRKFMWSQDGEGRGLAPVAWNGLCKSKENNALVFKLLKPFHEALMGKQLVKVYDKAPSPWAHVIQYKYKPLANV